MELLEKYDLDLMCLKAMKVNGEAERVALCAASIIVHAHAIARDAPERRDDALRIIALTRRLYAAMPTRDVVSDMVDDCLAELAAGRIDRRRAAAARERLVDRIWRHFHHGIVTHA